MVKIIEWQDEYSVGVEEIDAQHKELVETLDDLYNALLKAKGYEAAESTLERLTKYTREHFVTEERLFKKYRYPEEQEHKQEHAQFLQKLNSFIKAHERGDKRIGVDLVHFVRDWFENHLKVTDYRYISFFKEVGVAKRT